jgi:CheY-like chemotaxis protein
MGNIKWRKRFNRVLVIDDDTASRYLARAILEDMAIAKEVIPMPDAKEGLRFIEQYCINVHAALSHCPDLILLDITMPVMNGFEFLDALQEVGQHNILQAVIVVLTSSSNPKDQQKMLSYGVKGYITKPLTEQDIIDLVNYLDVN